MYYFGARYYDPALGRWLSTDPVPVGKPAGSGQFHSPYVYAGNNPLVMVDPDGEFAFLAASIGGVVGYFGGKSAGLRGWDLAFYSMASSIIGGISAGFGTSVGSGVSNSISFGGFAGGFISGAAGSAVGGFVAGTYTTAINNTMFGTGHNILSGGLRGAGIGALAGGLISGAIAGFDAVGSDASFWNGAYTGEVGGGEVWRGEFLDEKIPPGVKPTKTGEFASHEGNPDYGKFGWTRNGGTKAHFGVDYVGEIGDDVYAMYGGKVTRVWNSRSYGPNATRITTMLNGQYYNVDYGHLSERLVSLHQNVISGDLIGYMGRLGNLAPTNFPTHVHIAVWRPIPSHIMGFVTPYWRR